MDEIIKLEKQKTLLNMEKEKNKLRIQKLIQRKGKFDSGLKTCKNCNREYSEKENFNWSCTVHQSDYGGEMWWCCGKVGKDAKGCKCMKHESKEDEDDDDQEGNDEEKFKFKKNLRCFCCKEKGHTIVDCPRDPNLRTGQPTDNEHQRIQKIKDFRKLFGDTLV